MKSVRLAHGRGADRMMGGEIFMTLLDIAKVQPAITELDITARDENLLYVHRWIIGENASEKPMGIWRDVQDGKLTVISESVNAFGQKKGNGQPEIGYAFRPDAVPKELLTAPVTHLSMVPVQYGHKVSVDVIIDEPPLFRAANGGV